MSQWVVVSSSAYEKNLLYTFRMELTHFPGPNFRGWHCSSSFSEMGTEPHQIFWGYTTP